MSSGDLPAGAGASVPVEVRDAARDGVRNIVTIGGASRSIGTPGGGPSGGGVRCGGGGLHAGGVATAGRGCPGRPGGASGSVRAGRCGWRRLT